MQQALLGGELFLEYLPTVLLQHADRCCGCEALVHWRRKGVVVPPMAFIPHIEGTPVSGLLTYWVIDTVAHELEAWLRANPTAHVAINVPPEVLRRGGLQYAALKSRLDQVRRQLVLEITERGLPDQMGVEDVRGLAGEGVRIALDDLTPENSNLLVLSRVPVDILKIDKSAINGIDRPGCETVLEGLAGLVRASRHEVIAEGVERATQADALRRIGVQMAQGWLYAKALPVHDFIAWYATHR